MNVLTTVPVTVSPEAAAHVVRLGMQAEFERMVEHAQQTIPGLLRLDVILAPPYDTGDEDTILLEALRDPVTLRLNDPADDAWGKWRITTFPPDVYRHFVLMMSYGSNNGG